MPTRFYLPSTGAPPVGLPGLPSGWTAGDVPELELPGPATKSNTPLTDYSVGETTASVINVPIAAFISAPLDAQTISGTFSAVVRGLESNAGADDSLQIGIVLIDNLGTTIKSVLYAGHTAALNTTAGALGQEFTTAAQTRRFNAVALTSQTAVTGDRLVIVVGYRSHDTASTNRSTTLRFGDPSATADFANTAGLTTDLVPWVELSGTITFQSLTPVSDTFQTSWNVRAQIIDAWQTSWNVRREIPDSWQTSWDTFIQWQALATSTWASHASETWGTIAPPITLTPVSDTFQTSWNVRKEIADTLQTSWNVRAQISDVWQTSWIVRAIISDAWQTSWNVRTFITDSWQTSWNVVGSIIDSWQTSWNVLATIPDSYQTSWNVREAIQDVWSTSWNVDSLAGTTVVGDSWQTLWNVVGRASDTWQTSWNVLTSVSDSWQTSWGVRTLISDSWQTSWNVRGFTSDTFQTSWNVLRTQSDTWATSWGVKKEISDSWSTSWGVGGTAANSWTTYWDVESFVLWDEPEISDSLWTKQNVGASNYTKSNTSANTWTPVDSPVGVLDEVDKPTTIWSEA